MGAATVGVRTLKMLMYSLIFERECTPRTRVSLFREGYDSMLPLCSHHSHSGTYDGRHAVAEALLPLENVFVRLGLIHITRIKLDLYTCHSSIMKMLMIASTISSVA